VTTHTKQYFPERMNVAMYSTYLTARTGWQHNLPMLCAKVYFPKRYALYATEGGVHTRHMFPIKILRQAVLSNKLHLSPTLEEGSLFCAYVYNIEVIL